MNSGPIGRFAMPGGEPSKPPRPKGKKKKGGKKKPVMPMPKGGGNYA